MPYIGASLILATLLYFRAFKAHNFHGFLKLSLYFTVAFFIVAWLGQILILFYDIKSSTFSDELLIGKNSFFFERSFSISKSFLMTLAVALLLYIIGKVILKLQTIQKKDYLENYVPVILLIMGISLNFSNIIPAILLTFILALVFQFIFISLKKSQERISIVPYLLLASFTTHAATIFPSYATLLSRLHLI